MKPFEQLLQHPKKRLENVLVTQKQASAGGQKQLKVAVVIVDFSHRIPTAIVRLIELLCKLVMTTERALAVESGSLFRDNPRIYLARFPSGTLDAKDGILLQHNYGDVITCEQRAEEAAVLIE